MELLGKNSLKDNVKFVVLLKIFTYIFLMWTINCDKSTFGQSLEMEYEQDGLLNIRFNRLLAKRELKKDSYKTYARQKYANYGMNKNMKREAEKKSTYSQIRGGGLNKFDAYMKDYKNRYARKKGLAKLDCYYEKEVLKKINDIYEITDNMKNKKKNYNKKTYNKYLVCLVLYSTIPFLGLIFIFYFSELNPDMKKACFSNCRDLHEGTGPRPTSFSKAVSVHSSNRRRLLYISNDGFNIINIVNSIYLVLSTTIVLFVLLYTLLKLKKYARIKSGRGKMSLKEYSRFCKELIKAK